ncbi:hypothetical protein [Haloarcula sp. CGMCC 1.6347]
MTVFDLLMPVLRHTAVTHLKRGVTNALQLVDAVDAAGGDPR